MAETVCLTVDGKDVCVPLGCTVATAVFSAGVTAFRKSVRGEPRGPLCGMGTCFECSVTIDGQPHRRSCQTPCRDGMQVVTGG